MTYSLTELESLYERAKQAHRYPAMTLTVEAKDFAVAIWDNFPALLAELRRLEAERDELKAECERLRERWTVLESAAQFVLTDRMGASGIDRHKYWLVGRETCEALRAALTPPEQEKQT